MKYILQATGIVTGVILIGIAIYLAGFLIYPADPAFGSYMVFIVGASIGFTAFGLYWRDSTKKLNRKIDKIIDED